MTNTETIESAIRALATRKDPVRRASLAHTIRLMAEEIIREEVDQAREIGETWERIGDAIGMSKQGAQQRYGR